MAEKYQYPITSFLNNLVNTGKLMSEIGESSIVTALDYINTSLDHCDIWFKAPLTASDSTTLDSIVALHNGEPLPEIDPTPRMPDGRPIVRADTRPLSTMCYFTGRGDDSTSICHGQALRWDFSNSENDYTGPEVPSGYIAKQLLISFHCPVYLKDGTMYFFNAPWGAMVRMEIAVPPNHYYPNPKGNIPAAALGLMGDDRMFSYSGDDIVPYQVYVACHYMYGDCPMGDEFNAEGAAVDALPPGWYIRALILCPEGSTTFKGFGNLEMYRCHTLLLPGQTIDDIIAEH